MTVEQLADAAEKSSIFEDMTHVKVHGKTGTALLLGDAQMIAALSASEHIIIQSLQPVIKSIS